EPGWAGRPGRRTGPARGIAWGRGGVRAGLRALRGVPLGGRPRRGHSRQGRRGGPEGLHPLVRGLGAGGFGPADDPAGPRRPPSGLPDHLRQRPRLWGPLGRAVEPGERVGGGGDRVRDLAGPRPGAGRGAGGEGGPGVRRPVVRAVGALRGLRRPARAHTLLRRGLLRGRAHPDGLLEVLRRHKRRGRTCDLCLRLPRGTGTPVRPGLAGGVRGRDRRGDRGRHRPAPEAGRDRSV
ncbi:MAG: Alkaline phosphatase like protein, partial [uncultured Rubrobacteraceae bacterium]